MKFIFSLALLWTSVAFSIVPESYQLENGMKVCLMPMEADGEVFLEISAKGGYAFLPENKQVAGRIAADVVWESGLDGYSSEALSSWLYEKSVEIAPEVSPLYRKIEGSGDKEGLEALLEISLLIFKDPKLSETDLKKSLNRLSKKFQNKQRLKEVNFEVASHLLNTNNWIPFKPVDLEALRKVSYLDISNFYQKAFQSPEDFSLVIVGEFDLEKTKKQISKTLGRVPKKPSNFFKETPLLPPFHPSSQLVKIHQKGRIDALCRISFPLTIDINPLSLRKLDFFCKVLEEGLRAEIKSIYGKTQGIDVSYEFPFFPYLNQTWLIVQFHSDTELTDLLLNKVELTLQKLQKNGFNPEWITLAKEEADSAEAFWKNEASARLSHLSNVLLFGWDPEEADLWDVPPDMNEKDVADIINKTLNLNNSTRVLLLP